MKRSLLLLSLSIAAAAATWPHAARAQEEPTANTPTPASTPEPAPAPEPVPVPVPEPAPVPEPVPEPAPASEPVPAPEPAPAPTTATVSSSPAARSWTARALGWRATGLTAPLIRWSANASTLLAVSDRYAGGDRPGWLFQVAPRLLVERPPARVSGWLMYEPSFSTRAGVRPRPDSAFDLNQQGRYAARPSTREDSFVHQGSAGLSVGDGTGTRLAAQAARRMTLDRLLTEQDGLVEHDETGGTVALEWIAPDRGSLGLRGGATHVRYPSLLARRADHDRMDAALQASARIRLRMTTRLSLEGSQTEYFRVRDQDGDVRVVRTARALAHLEAQPIPNLAIRAGGGPAMREDGDSAFDFPMYAGATADLLRRYRISLDGGTALEDSLWRNNRRVRAVHANARFATSLGESLDAGVFAGGTETRYPRREIDHDSTLRNRQDRTLGGGAEVAARLGERVRATASVSHSRRSSTFRGYEWEENRCVLSAFVEW